METTSSITSASLLKGAPAATSLKEETLMGAVLQLSKKDMAGLIQALVTSGGPSAAEVASRFIDGRHKVPSSVNANANANAKTSTAAATSSSASTSCVEESGGADMKVGGGHDGGDSSNFSEQKQEHQQKKKDKKVKVFDMSKYRQRQIALQIQYDGGRYYGFAAQAEEAEDTVEKHVFDALLKLKLIESRQSCNYSRCGRTDRGVSALGQIVSLRLRSSIPLSTRDEDMPKHPNDRVKVVGNAASGGDDNNGGGKGAATTQEIAEMDYCGILNRSLPDDIRVLGWCEVTDQFSARFSATQRTYRYFFVKGTLDIGLMGEAAKLLIGDHDFRNFCKIDIANVSNFRREVLDANILPVTNSLGFVDEDDDSAVYMLQITGVAFLWHQVRCIMAILFIVGKRQERADIVTALLDVTNVSSKPSYSFAPEEPLVLHHCGFDNLRVSFFFCIKTYIYIHEHVSMTIKITLQLC